MRSEGAAGAADEEAGAAGMLIVQPPELEAETLDRANGEFHKLGPIGSLASRAAGLPSAPINSDQF